MPPQQQQQQQMFQMPPHQQQQQQQQQPIVPHDSSIIDLVHLNDNRFEINFPNFVFWYAHFLGIGNAHNFYFQCFLDKVALTQIMD